MGETIDNGHPPVKKSVLSHFRAKGQGRKMSASVEMAEILHGPRFNKQLPAKTSGNTWSNSSNSTDNSDEFPNDTSGPAHAPVTRTSSGRSVSMAPDEPMVEEDEEKEKEEEGEEKEGGEEKDGRVSDLEKELMATKCELAKVLNRQSTFEEILQQKDEIIEDLDEKLGNISSSHDAYDSKRRISAAAKENQERVRVLQNQNRFLNEEVRRLAKLRSQEHEKIKQQDSKVRSLEADIEVWKLEYISLIQSSIRFTGTDTMDDAELSLFGGDRHKHRILSLLDEARKINPSLPTYEHLASGEVHVDCYGFKHHFTDDGLLLHYLCQELNQHFLSQASTYEKHQKNWLLYLKNKSKNLFVSKKELKALVRAGIPDPHRKQMWRAFVMHQVEDIVVEKGAHYFRSLCSAVPDSPMAARYRKQISLDLMRTMPSNVKFSTPGSKGVMDLQDVLLAFCIHNPSVGYCQGMNFLVAMALLFMDAQDAFWALVAVTERYHSPSYFDHNLLGAQADQMVLHDLMAEKMPELAKHLDAIDIEISTVTLNWFLAIFFDAVPFHTLLRVWDCFLLEGPKVLFRFSLAILHVHSKEIIQKCDTISVMRHLKVCARLTYDVDGMVRAAFKSLKPFPRRQDIVSKQTCYLNALKEKYRWRDMQRVAFAERENLFLSMECDADNYKGFECCAVTRPGEAWVAYGEPPNAKICIVDCREQTMTDTSITFDTRVMSMAAVGEEIVLMGTLSWFVFAYNQYTREMAWQQRLHDAVLSMQVFKEDDDDHSLRLFAGLADGTVAVFETISLSCTTYDPLYLPIGQSPVTCLQLLDNHLWCACGNTVSIIHASTLDPMDRFSVSANPYDSVLSLMPGIPGVWISVRGSSVLELWDPLSLSCRMLYDTRTGKYPNLRKEDDTYFNAARITSILALDHSVWVGTGEGTLITFDVFTQSQKPSSDTSSFITDNMLSASELEGQTGRSTLSLKSDCESYARLVEVEKRVKELYVQGFIGSYQLDIDTYDESREEERRGSCVEKEQEFEKHDSVRRSSEDLGSERLGVDRRRKSEGAPRSKDSPSSGEMSSQESYTTGVGRNKGSLRLDTGLSSSKNDLCKTVSADSAITNTSGRTDVSDGTDLSAKTDTSMVSSNVSYTDANESNLEDFTLHDSGFAQISDRSSGSSSHTENSLNDTLQDTATHDDIQTNVCTTQASNGHLDERVAQKLDVCQLSRNGVERKDILQSGSDMSNSERPENGNVKLQDSTETDSRSMRERLTRKSSDSGISSLCDKNTEDNSDFQNNNKKYPLERKASFEEASHEINHSAVQPTKEELQNLKNKMHSLSAAENIEGCINKSSQFHTGMKAAKVVTSTDSKNSMSLESNGRSESQESSKTTLSDEVFQDQLVSATETEPSDLNPSAQNKDKSLTQLKKGELGSPGMFCNGIAKDLNENISEDLYENGQRHNSTSSDEENEQNTEPAGTILDLENPTKFTSVKSLAAKFEARVGPKTNTLLKTPLGRTQSLKANFRPLVEPSAISEERSVPNGTLPHLLNENTDSDSVSVTPVSDILSNANASGDSESSSVTPVPESLNAAPAFPDSGSSDNATVKPFPEQITIPHDSDDQDPIPAVKSHNKLHRLGGNMPTKSELRAAALQLGKELENSKIMGSPVEHEALPTLPTVNLEHVAGETGPQQSETVSKAKSQPQLHQLSVSPIDTKFYGDSDEDSLVHEARVKSYKDTYKRLSATTTKARAQSEPNPESSTSTPGSSPGKPGPTFYVQNDANEVSCEAGTGSFNKKPVPTEPSVGTSALSKKMSVDSIERRSSETSLMGNVQPGDPDAQWRLDYTNIHVDTDRESSTMSCDGDKDGEGDSEPPSRRLSCLSTGSDIKDHRLNQFLRDTANSFTQQFGFPLEDDTHIKAFLSTPTMSGCNSAAWSSYDEISTPSYADADGVKGGPVAMRFPRASAFNADSRTTSIASTMDLYYGADLSLMSKNKISDKPVKWLVTTESQGKPVILSFSGGHSDDEAVLIWSREANETLWTNCPVFEYNPKTRTATLPRYMRPQLSSSSSTRSSPKQRPGSVNSTKD